MKNKVKFRSYNKIILFLLLLITACSRNIEIPKNKVGIEYRGDAGEIKIKESILKNGSHTVNFFSKVALFDINEQQKDFSFDILFTDATSADIDFSIKYIPRIDSLAKICQEYKDAVRYGSLDLIVESETRSQVRTRLMEVNKNELNREAIFTLIEKELKTKNPVARVIEIKSFSSGKITFKN